MLTSDLLRTFTRKGVVKPRYVEGEDAELLTLAAGLIAAFEAHVGRPRGELDEAIEDVVGEGVDPLLRRGLVKLLSDRSTFEVATAVDPREIRAVVFGISAQFFPVTLDTEARVDVALVTDGGLKGGGRELEGFESEGALPLAGEAGAHPGLAFSYVHRDAVLKAAGAQLGLSPEEVLQGLYGDLPEALSLTAFEPLGPAELLDRYNTALAQGVLLRATSLHLTLRGLKQARLRQIFRVIKFRRLMYQVTEEKEGVYTVVLDGPVSLFQASNRYGLNMALFLPVLLNMEGWTLEATLQWGAKREERHFKLSPKEGLVGHHKDRGVYRTQQEAWFLERFAVLDTPWTLDDRPPLLKAGGQEIVVPDYALRHPDGRVAYLEILGFWRKGSLKTRLAQLEAADLGHLILAVSKSLQGSQGGLDDVPGAVVYFREIIPPKEVVTRAEAVGRVEEAPRKKGRAPRKAKGAHKKAPHPGGGGPKGSTEAEPGGGRPQSQEG